MRHRSPIILRGGLLILGCALVAAPVCSDELDDFVRATMEKHNIPGMAIAVVRDGEPARVRGYGLANIELTVVVLANAAGTPTEMIAHEIAGMVDDDLRLPDPETPGVDPDPRRTARLEGLLEAWAEWRTTPDMGRGLAATASGSIRESFNRRRTGQLLKRKKSFSWLDDDDLSSISMERLGETVTRIAYYALVTEDARRVYRFYLTADGKVADFGSERH